MSRVQLEQVTVDGLRELARQYEIDRRGLRAALTEKLLDHFERNGWPDHLGLTGPSNVDEQNPMHLAEANAPTAQKGEEHQANAGADLAANNVPMSLVAARLVPERFVATDTLSPRVTEQIRTIGRCFDNPARSNHFPSNHDSARASSHTSPPISRGPTPNFNNWSQIKFIAKLIPLFSWKDEENIVRWIEQITSIARLYNGWRRSDIAGSSKPTF